MQQKYLLQRRNGEGFLLKVETFDHQIEPEEVLRRFGPGYYILKATKPRFKTVWKKRLGDSENANDQGSDLDKIRRRTKHLTYGLVGVAVGEVVGFGLSHLRFCDIEDRVDRIEKIINIFKPEGLRCGVCGGALDFFLQKHCSQCGAELDWPGKKQHPAIPENGAVECPGCRLPLLKHQAYCPNCGRQRPIQASYSFEPLA